MTSSINLTRRVLTSAVALAVRTAWERGLTLVSTLVVARLLTPSDLGEAAIVLSVTGVAMTLIDAGLTTSLVRQVDQPSRETVHMARRLQLALAFGLVAIGAVTTAVTPSLGALLLLSSLKLPARAATLATRVSVQRSLDFRGLALADGIGQFVQAITAIGLVVIDRGPGALIGGDLLGALAVSAVIGLRLRRTVAPLPTIGAAPSLRAVLRDGAPFQGFSVLVAFRDLATALFVSVLVGTRDLGLLQFAYRVLSPVLIVFQAIGQLAIPVGAQALQGDAKTQRKIADGFLVTGAVTAIVLATAAAPARWLVPELFGPRWHDAVGVVAAIAFALVIAGPINSLGVGLLVAARRVGVAAIAVAGCTIWFMASMTALLPLGGVAAGALAWIGMAIVESTIVVVACRRLLGLRLESATATPAALYAAGYLAGAGAGTLAHGWLAATLLAAGVAAVVTLGLSCVVALRPLRSLMADARRPAPVQPDLAVAAGAPA